jgi:hypothetical protein
MWLVSCVWCVFAPLPGVSSMDAELCPVGRVAHAWGTLLGAEGLAGGTFHWEVFGAHLLPEMTFRHNWKRFRRTAPGTQEQSVLLYSTYQ